MTADSSVLLHADGAKSEQFFWWKNEGYVCQKKVENIIVDGLNVKKSCLIYITYVSISSNLFL